MSTNGKPKLLFYDYSCQFFFSRQSPRGTVDNLHIASISKSETFKKFWRWYDAKYLGMRNIQNFASIIFRFMTSLLTDTLVGTRYLFWSLHLSTHIEALSLKNFLEWLFSIWKKWRNWRKVRNMLKEIESFNIN